MKFRPIQDDSVPRITAFTSTGGTALDLDPLIDRHDAAEAVGSNYYLGA
ncbi:MAG TPA: hypothetical protein VIZ17_00270 [Acetobacteraceae bacterium]